MIALTSSRVLLLAEPVLTVIDEGCSACVQSCPTGVLQFGRVDRAGNVIDYDALAASPVLMSEARLTVMGKPLGIGR